MAVFRAEGFRQLDRFVDRHLVRDILTHFQFKQRDAQHCALHLAQLFELTRQVWRHQFVQHTCIHCRAGQQLAKIGDVNIFDILLRQELVFNIGKVVFRQLPRVKRLNSALTSAATSSRFHGIPLN
ncbi:hypothetical protein AK51_24730 [Serratia nematodiphila DZ0503SBS1]|nr:hypothetical protein AK51_24730 [Serratia nematodiphila DZ0503SBS1]